MVVNFSNRILILFFKQQAQLIEQMNRMWFSNIFDATRRKPWSFLVAENVIISIHKFLVHFMERVPTRSFISGQNFYLFTVEFFHIFMNFFLRRHS